MAEVNSAVLPQNVAMQGSGSLASALRLALLFAAAKLVFQFALTLWTKHIGYGYFRDEFYYLACGRHLAWGYVDHGPIVALQARLGELLFGDSVFAIRILSAAQAPRLFSSPASSPGCSAADVPHKHSPCSASSSAPNT